MVRAYAAAVDRWTQHELTPLIKQRGQIASEYSAPSPSFARRALGSGVNAFAHHVRHTRTTHVAFVTRSPIRRRPGSSIT